MSYLHWFNAVCILMGLATLLGIVCDVVRERVTR